MFDSEVRSNSDIMKTEDLRLSKEDIKLLVYVVSVENSTLLLLSSSPHFSKFATLNYLISYAFSASSQVIDPFCITFFSLSRTVTSAGIFSYFFFYG